MRITGIETRVIRMPLIEPYTIAYERVEAAANVLVWIRTDGAHRGLGCAAPDPAVTGEDLDDVVEALRTIVPSTLAGLDPRRTAACLEALHAPLVDRPATLAAVDMALYDLLGRVAGLPLYVLLGGYRQRMATSVTIGINAVDRTLELAQAYVGRGFRALKIKGGIEVDADVERVRRVRETVGPEIELRFDANQGYTVEQAARFVEATRPARLELLEQPTAADRPEELGSVSEAAHLPVMADESLLTLRDAFRLAAEEQADMVNVKLMKVGGIARARRIDAVARSARLETMVGCMDECALSIGAGLAFALSSANVAYADLDGHLDLSDDPTTAAIRLDHGDLVPCERPGLGLDLEPDDLDRVRVAS